MKTTAAMTARAMRATRRMYSTKLAPCSSLAIFAWSHVLSTNRFMLPNLSVSHDQKRCEVPGSFPASTTPGLTVVDSAVRRQLRAGLAELAGSLVAQEDHRRDDRKSDEGHEEDVLHQAGAVLVLVHLGLEPGLEHEEVHVLSLSGVVAGAPVAPAKTTIGVHSRGLDPNLCDFLVIHRYCQWPCCS